MGQEATGSTDVRLTASGYEAIRRASETYREELVVRLCGEVGLRAAEVTRLRPDDVTERAIGGQTRYFLSVDEGDDSREAYLPGAVAHDFLQYVRSHDVADDERVIPVTPRRVQMLVSDVAERAAEATGHHDLASVTPTTLRHHFARQLLVRHGVDPRVVLSVGGWAGLDGLLPDRDEPDRPAVVEAFDRLDGEDPSETGRLASVVDVFADVGEVLVGAGSRAAIETDVCDRLGAGVPYEAAWFVQRRSHADAVAVMASAGDDTRDLGNVGLVRRALDAGRVLVGPDHGARQPEQTLLAAVPVGHDDADYGALVVRAGTRSAFEDPEQTALTDLGRRVGFAITAVERKQLLLGDAVLALEFTYDDREAVFVDSSAALGCSVSLEGIVSGDDGAIVCFCTVSGVAGDDALSHLTDREDVEARLLRSKADGALLEVVLQDESPVRTLAARGGRLADLEVTDGRATVVAEFAPETDVRAVRDALKSRYPSTSLQRKEETERAGTTPADLRATVESDLTDKQRSVLRAAYHAGYFEWPRGSTAEELADTLGISSPTLHNHLRKAQGKLFETVVESDH
ncbi:bacterio-opsin activator domain-containing protein [Halobacteriales archaeon Cl-PHB]